MDGSLRTVLQESLSDQAVIDKFALKAAEIVGPENVSENQSDLLSTCRDYWPVVNIWMLEVPWLMKLKFRLCPSERGQERLVG